MRVILIGLFLAIYAIFTIPMLLVEFILGKINPRKKALVAQYCVQKAFKFILFISGVNMTVKGEENILHGKAALYAYNHRGYFDALCCYSTAPVPTAFIAKKEVGHAHMISWWMKCMNCLFLDRNDSKSGMKTIQEGIKLLKGGTSIYIAPEGTRTSGIELKEFSDASFRLAEMAKCPIVPIAINNTDEVFENHFPWVRSTHVIVEYCKPIYLDNMERSEKRNIAPKVRDIIAERLKENIKEI